MTWMTPLVHSMSAMVTVAIPLSITWSSTTEIDTSAPLSVVAELMPITSAAHTWPPTAW